MWAEVNQVHSTAELPPDVPQFKVPPSSNTQFQQSQVFRIKFPAFKIAFSVVFKSTALQAKNIIVPAFNLLSNMPWRHMEE
jgi:hypothetical protein